MRRHPVASYLAMVFAIAWVGSFLAVGPQFIRGDTIASSASGLAALAMLSAPVLSGTWMTYLVHGKQGLRNLVDRMKIWRLGRWYLTLLIFPCLILVVSFALSAFVSPRFAPVFVAVGIVTGIAAGFLEEIGWMGFCYTAMRSSHGDLRAGVYLGFLHGLWHLVVWFLIQYSDLGRYWLPYFIAFVLSLVALRIIIVWAYSNTNSLLLAQLLHASSTGFLVVLTPTAIESVHWFVFYAVYAAVLWAVALVVVQTHGKTVLEHGGSLR